MTLIKSESTLQSILKLKALFPSLLVVLVGSCKTSPEESNAKLQFTTFAQRGNYTGAFDNLLIHKIEKGIKYRVKILETPSKPNVYEIWRNNNLGDHAKGNCIDQVEATRMVKNAFPSWLKYLPSNVTVAKPKPVSAGEKADLEVNFMCKFIARSLVDPRAQPLQMYLWPENRSNFSQGTLNHEMGHTFGLSDIYDSNRPSQTKGTQPFNSIMSNSTILEPTPDDGAGLRWLYDYHVTKEYELSECPTGYMKDVDWPGCTPSIESPATLESFCLHAGGQVKNGLCSCGEEHPSFNPRTEDFHCSNFPRLIDASVWSIQCVLDTRDKTIGLIWLYPRTNSVRINFSNQYASSRHIGVSYDLRDIHSKRIDRELVLNILHTLATETLAESDIGWWIPLEDCR